MKDPDDDTEMITLIETEEGYEGADLEPGVVTNPIIICPHFRNWCPLYQTFLPNFPTKLSADYVKHLP